MALSLLEYLTKLSTDAKMMESYKEDREKAMLDCKVSEEDIKLVLANDYEAIKNILGPEYEITINHIIDVFKK